jgi:hypothetical protein
MPTQQAGLKSMPNCANYLKKGGEGHLDVATSPNQIHFVNGYNQPVYVNILHGPTMTVLSWTTFCHWPTPSRPSQASPITFTNCKTRLDFKCYLKNRRAVWSLQKAIRAKLISWHKSPAAPTAAYYLM